MIIKHLVGIHLSVIIFLNVLCILINMHIVFFSLFYSGYENKIQHYIWLTCLLIYRFFLFFPLVLAMLLLLVLNKVSHFICSFHSQNFTHCIPVVSFYMSLCPLYFL